MMSVPSISKSAQAETHFTEGKLIKKTSHRSEVLV